MSCADQKEVETLRLWPYSFINSDADMRKFCAYIVISVSRVTGMWHALH